MSKQELIEKLLEFFSYDHLENMDLEELQDNYILKFADDLKIDWLESTMDGFIGSLEEYIKETLDIERDITSLIYDIY